MPNEGGQTQVLNYKSAKPTGLLPERPDPTRPGQARKFKLRRCWWCLTIICAACCCLGPASSPVGAAIKLMPSDLSLSFAFCQPCLPSTWWHFKDPTGSPSEPSASCPAPATPPAHTHSSELVVRLPHIWIFHFKHTSLEMRRQSVRFQYFLVLEPNHKGNRATRKTRMEPAMMMTGRWAWGVFVRVGVPYAPYVSVHVACVCAACVRLGCTVACNLAMCVCGLWHVQAHVIYQTLDAPVCSNRLAPAHSRIPRLHALWAILCASSSLWYCCWWRCRRCFFNKCGCWPIPAVNHKSALMMYFMVLCFGIISHIFGFCCTFLSRVQQPPSAGCVCNSSIRVHAISSSSNIRSSSNGSGSANWINCDLESACNFR